MTGTLPSAGQMASTAEQAGAGIRLEHLQTLWDHAPHPVWVHQDLRLVYVNNAAVQVFGGQSADDMLGRSPLDFVDEPSRNLVQQRIRTILNGKATPRHLLHLRRCDRSLFDAEVVAWPIVFEGAPAVQATLHDLTEKVRTEAELRQSQSTYEQLVELLPQMVWTTDAEGRPDFYNRRWYDYTGVGIGTTDGEAWVSVVHPEDADRAFAVWQKAVSTGAQYEVEYRLRSGDGSYRWFLGRGNPLRDAGGRIVRWFGTCTDIDEQRRTREALIEKEERFRTATLAVSDLLWTNDEHGRMVGEQPGWGGFTGQSFDEYQGYGWSKALHPDDVEPTIRGWEEAVEKRRMYIVEHRVRRYDGVYRLFVVRALPVLRADGSVREWVGVHRDVTDRRAQIEEIRRLNTQLEERVRQRTAELVASNRELEAFSYSVSHDLRAPLRTIDGFSTALEEDVGPLLNERSQDYLRRIHSGVAQMNRLIDVLLQLSRVTRADIDRDQVNLSELAREVVKQLRRTYPDRPFEVEIESGIVVDGDSRMLHVVLANLFANAFKFTGKTVAPLIRFGSFDHDGQRAFFVKDNGAGFDMKFAGKLFQPFQRLHGEKDFPGSGIGLATVRRAILRHGGEVWAESGPDGASFYFTLG